MPEAWSPLSTETCAYATGSFTSLSRSTCLTSGLVAASKTASQPPSGRPVLESAEGLSRTVDQERGSFRTMSSSGLATNVWLGAPQAVRAPARTSSAARRPRNLRQPVMLTSPSAGPRLVDIDLLSTVEQGSL